MSTRSAQLSFITSNVVVDSIIDEAANLTSAETTCLEENTERGPFEGFTVPESLNLTTFT